MSLNHLLDTKELDIKAKTLDIDTLTTNEVTANSIKVQGQDIYPDSEFYSSLPGLNFSFTIGGSQYNTNLQNGRCILFKTGNVYTVMVRGDITTGGISPGDIIFSIEIPHAGTLNTNSIVCSSASARTNVSLYTPPYGNLAVLSSPTPQIAKIEQSMSTPTADTFSDLQFNASFSFLVSGL